MDIPRELLDQFLSIADLSEADKPLASQLLIDSNLNLETALASYFAIQDAKGVVDETPATSGPAAPDTMNDAQFAAQLAAEDGQDEVRAPISQVVDTLLPSAPPRRNQTVYDPFTGSGGGDGDNRLSELFRPPEHLIFRGSLDEAMASGQTKKRWILVTIHQADIFQCQVLNRDVWNDSSVQQLLEAFFLFWQRDISSDDGQRYKQFYKIPEPPHIAIIDPRSGERVVSLSGDQSEAFTVEQIVRYLTEFTTNNTLDSSAPVRRPAFLSDNSNQHSAAAASSSTHAQASSSISPEDDLAMTDDAQLAAAIAASIESSGDAMVDTPMETVNGTSNGMNGTHSSSGMASTSAVSREVSRQMSAYNPTLNDARNLRAQQDMEYEASLAMDRAKEESKREEESRQKRETEARDAKRCRVPPEPPVGAKGVAELVVRLPNNDRLKRRFLVTDTIGAVYDFVETESETVTGLEYDLMTPFPKKTLADRSTLIGDAGLSPRALLVVHVR